MYISSWALRLNSRLQTYPAASSPSCLDAYLMDHSNNMSHELLIFPTPKATSLPAFFIWVRTSLFLQHSDQTLWLSVTFSFSHTSHPVWQQILSAPVSKYIQSLITSTLPPNRNHHHLVCRYLQYSLLPGLLLLPLKRSSWSVCQIMLLPCSNPSNDFPFQGTHHSS